MKSSDISVVLRPRSVGASIDLAVLLLRTYRRRWAPLSAPAVLVCFVVVFPVLLWLPDTLPLSASASEAENQLALVLVHLSALTVGPAVLAPVLQIPFVLLGGELLFGGGRGSRALLRTALTSIGVAGHLLVAQFSVFGLALISCGTVVPVAVLPVYFLPEVLLLERQRGLAAWRRSAALGLGIGPWQAFAGSMVGLFLFLWWPYSAGLALRTVLDSGLGLQSVRVTTLGSVLEAMTQAIAYGTAFAMCAAVRLALYMDARTREEHWDVDVALRGAAERP